MKKTSKTKRTASAESIARLADKGQDISAYFTNKGKMMPPLDSFGVDLNKDLIDELTEAARKLKVTRQTLIKRFIRHGLDQHYMAQRARKVG
jgi:hypothetical protein